MVFFLVVVCIPSASGGEEGISCFVIGVVDPAQNAFAAFFRVDPLFTYSVEPLPPDLSNQEKQRLDRLYYPRSRDALIQDYDLMVFRTARITHFTSRQLDDLDFAFREGAMTAINTFSLEWDSVWIVSKLYDVVPVKDYHTYIRRAFRVMFRREREPVFLPFVNLGLEEVWGMGWHTMEAKHGATTWADMVPYGLPWLVSWTPGGGDPGVQWVFPGGFDAEWFGDSNPYAIDFGTNLILHSLGRPLISDIHARREARHLISAVHAQKVVILDMADWADSFGADTTELIERLFKIEADAGEATVFYLDRDYTSAIARMEEIFGRIVEVTGDAVSLKDRAMLWVFASEWLIVTSASIVSGLVLWNLMVERKKYREVRATRLEQL
jgi:hypothetical protein